MAHVDGLAESAPWVSLNGIPGAKRVFQFPSPGEYLIRASAFFNGMASGQTVRIDVRECAEAATHARLSVDVSPYSPYLTNFRVLNAADFPGPSRRFLWDFGDGTTEETNVPYIEHSYLSSLDATTETLSFDAVLKIRRDGHEDIVTPKTVTMSNFYAETRVRGFVRPPVVANERMVRDGRALRGSFTISNLEPTPLTLRTRRLQRHFCDPDLDPVTIGEDPSAWRIGTFSTGEALTVASNGTTSQELVLDNTQFGSNVCAVTLLFEGSTGSGVAARVAVHFETPEPGLFTAQVNNPGLRNVLNYVASSGLVSDRDHLNERDLERLWQQDYIGEPPGIGDIDAGALQAGGTLGARCDPEQAPPEAGISCQATEDWTVTPPLIRNALKGDIFIVAGCGPIGQLFRVLLPRQTYTHEGIMTRNYYALSHTTVEPGRIIDSVGHGLRKNMDENILRYGWPGAVHASVNAAFNGRPEIDPDGKVWKVSGFRASGTQCQGDAALNPPIVIRPPPGADSSIRSQLHAAADFAAGVQSHYRFFAYTQANIAFGPDGNFDGGNYVGPTDGEIAQVSTSFIWHALKSVGVNLEGTNQLEDADVRRGAAAPPTDGGIVDGLYLYSESDRREGAMQIYSSTYNSVKAAQGGFGVFNVFTDQADDIASQFTNCFGSDQCGEDGAQSRDYESPGAGVAVSPDDFRFWDGPDTGGVFGDEELLIYRSADYRRIYRWAPSGGTGSVSGTVKFADGTPVQGATITVAGKDDGSSALGEFDIRAVPAGIFEVRAEKSVLRADHSQPCPPDGSDLCDHLIDVERITVAADADTSVEFVLEVERAIPPPTLKLHSRRVEFSGTAHLVDHEAVRANEVGDFALLGACEVSPLQRSATTAIPGTRMCVGGELVVEIIAHCDIRDDNETVDVTIETVMREGRNCGTNDVADRKAVGPIAACAAPAGCGGTVSIHLYNGERFGGDTADIQLAFRNVSGAQEITLPNVRPENMRRVTLSGDIEIEDDDVFDLESDRFVLGEECLVDPYHREDTVSWSRCVAGEVRLEIDIDCELMYDNVGVNADVHARLYEGVSCGSDDEDGNQNRSFVVAPCDGSCVPVTSDFKVENTDERGDWARVVLRMVNERR
ncbi:carboxypeptidase-like regulatory domain-containing protein [Sorangium atrum]|uniref:Carboxypeptidase-like regulatory domain-containing protein n=1 Tax=Sorangium atrum TaxID=2995308 RepID=A0ABT5CGD1_9BACT|nr:carboxypeptidase-like regulatory domain-containing protein [Sorangium aterium]MDC0685489.1 carboxypeptidase-like regulatory domain-containing protein [Sorangium aterium]